MFVLKVNQNHKGGTLYRIQLSEFAGAVHGEEIAEEKLCVFELNQKLFESSSWSTTTTLLLHNLLSIFLKHFGVLKVKHLKCLIFPA